MDNRGITILGLIALTAISIIAGATSFVNLRYIEMSRVLQQECLAKAGGYSYLADKSWCLADGAQITMSRGFGK